MVENRYLETVEYIGYDPGVDLIVFETRTILVLFRINPDLHENYQSEYFFLVPLGTVHRCGH